MENTELGNCVSDETNYIVKQRDSPFVTMKLTETENTSVKTSYLYSGYFLLSKIANKKMNICILNLYAMRMILINDNNAKETKEIEFFQCKYQKFD